MPRAGRQCFRRELAEPLMWYRLTVPGFRAMTEHCGRIRRKQGVDGGEIRSGWTPAHLVIETGWLSSAPPLCLLPDVGSIGLRRT